MRLRCFRKAAGDECKTTAVRALAGAEPISAPATRHGVSRPLAYRQMHKASAALNEIFSPTQIDDAGKVLFSLPLPDDGWSRALAR
jgi:hypothetical protein